MCVEDVCPQLTLGKIDGVPAVLERMHGAEAVKTVSAQAVGNVDR